MSFAHMLILGIIAIIVIPPEKLPEVAKQIAKFIYELKRSADQFMGDIKKEAMFKPEEIIDQNLKNKLYELQNQINQPLNIDKKPENGLVVETSPESNTESINEPNKVHSNNETTPENKKHE